MIAICEECGAKYEADTNRINGDSDDFRCIECAHIITVSKPVEIAPKSDLPPAIEAVKLTQPQTSPKKPPPKKERSTKKVRGLRKSLGIRSKMFILLILIPAIMLLAALPFANKYIDATISEVIHESSLAEIERAKNQMNQSASAIAKQVEFYLLDHPELNRYNINQDPGIQKILFQQTLMSAEASLYLRFDSQRQSTFLVSRDSALEGKPVDSIMTSGTLDDSRYDQFGKIIKVGSGNEHREANDFYLSRDSEGNLKERIMIMAPVSKTLFGVFLSADTDDFMLPVKLLEDRIERLITKTKYAVISIVGGTLLLIAVIVLLFSHRLTSKINALMDTANRISVGELDIQIEAISGDEIGELAESISRMQDSIRLSIERLRRYR